MVAYSRALALTSVAELTAVLLVTEIVAPGLAGIALLGDTVRPGWWWVLAIGLALAVTGGAGAGRLAGPAAPTATDRASAPNTPAFPAPQARGGLASTP